MDVRLETEARKVTRRVLQRQFRQSLGSHTTIPVERQAAESKRSSPVRGMEPLTIDRTHILVLTYNGRDLLAECLPSIALAAARSAVPCGVTVVDNESTDGSAELVSQRWPGVRVVREQNRGLASFNRVLTALDEPVVLLLNNDVKLAPSAVAPLLRVFENHDDALFSAPLCWSFDGRDYEGMRTRVRSKFGLVQGMCRVPGHERVLDRADLTASRVPCLPSTAASSSRLAGTIPSTSRDGSRISTWAFAAGWPASRGITSPDPSPAIGALAPSGRKWESSAATRWRSATASCSRGRT